VRGKRVKRQPFPTSPSNSIFRERQHASMAHPPMQGVGLRSTLSLKSMSKLTCDNRL